MTTLNYSVIAPLFCALSIFFKTEFELAGKHHVGPPTTTTATASWSPASPNAPANIRKGVGLKKVPDSMKNDRSAPVKADSPRGSVSGGGGTVRGPPVGGGGGGGIPSQGDIKSRLNAMFGGSAVPQAGPPTPRAPAQPSPAHARPQAPVPPQMPTGMPMKPSAPREVPPPLPSEPSAVGDVPVLSNSRGPRPSVPSRSYKERAQPATPMMPAPPPPCPTVNGSMGNSTEPWDRRFTFPDKSTFPPPPPHYTGTKTYIGHRQE
ncbi:hypothetical protein SprV_0902665900 [Sparganum proliferum]